jgi:RNA recognition motif-containing protein
MLDLHTSVNNIPSYQQQQLIGLYMLNVPEWVRVPEIISVFSRFGSIVNVGIEPPVNAEPAYAFVDFENEESAATAIQEFNGKIFFEMKTPLQLQPRFDKNSRPVFYLTKTFEKNLEPAVDYCTLYIPNLPPHISKYQLESTFKVFGLLKRVHIAVKSKDHRHFAFITFKVAECAEKALCFARNNLLFGLAEPLKMDYSKILDNNHNTASNPSLNKSASTNSLRPIRSPILTETPVITLEELEKEPAESAMNDIVISLEELTT